MAASDSGPRIHKSGGRTRSVINVASVGDAGVPAYTFEATTGAPAGTTDGYANYGQNKNLHILIMNNAAGGSCVLKIYAYHSFAQEWAVLQGIDPTDGSHHDITLTVANNLDEYFIVPIEGVERIAIRCTTYGGGSNTVSCYLGVNSI